MIWPISHPTAAHFHSGNRARCILSFVVEFAPIIIAGIKLVYLVAGHGTGVGVSLTQLSGARRNLFATHLRGNLMFVNLRDRRRTEVDDRPRESRWNLECNFHRSHFALWLAHCYLKLN